ncbi:patatin-like phospholipase family protein [Massilia kyonggiensis]|nr:patatin-like phospholipase family protein [Massilia kyonggiensis]
MSKLPPNLEQNLSSDMVRKLDALGLHASEDRLAALLKYTKGKGQPTNIPDIWTKLNDEAGSTFSEVFQFELDALDGNPDARLGPARLTDVNRRAHQAKLSGLAFSGGGIRSATFNLGVIEALAEMRMLRHFDYLSTVSGGGYIGGWLSKLIAGHQGDVEKVEEELAPSAFGDAPRSEPDAVQFLRRYSNYLTPRTGLFSADTWTLLLTYVRNTLLNMSMLTAWLAAALLLPRMLVVFVDRAHAAAPSLLNIAAISSFLVAVFFIALSISRRGGSMDKGWFSQKQEWILVTVCLPLICAGVLGSIALSRQRHALATFWNDLPPSLMQDSAVVLLLPGVVYFLTWGAGWLCAQIRNRLDQRREPPNPGIPPAPHNQFFREAFGHMACAIGALALGTVLLLKCMSLWDASLGGRSDQVNVIALTTIGMPLMLGLFGITMTLMIGLIGRLYSDQSREWWARMSAWNGIICVAWILGFGCTYYLPPLVHWTFDRHALVANAGTVISAVITWAGLRSGSGPDTAEGKNHKRLELIAQVAPYAFSLLLFAALATALQWSVSGPVAIQGKALTDYVEAYTAHHLTFDAIWPTFLLVLAVAALLGWRVDINKFSLYMMYRLRLVRAYFGASSVTRSPHPFTGFDPADDPDLAALLKKSGAPGSPAELQRPYHIINATLNLVGGKELAWQNRKAANFFFTPGYSGFETPTLANDKRSARCKQQGAFRSTACYASTSTTDDPDSVVKLGAAVAISGAAASPNMGYHSSPPLSFLMTLFNLRLGRWSPNPMKPGTWKRTAPRIGLFSLLSELFGMTDMDAKFLYLSDGGHFENLGLYELVRRRCRFIVVVDASADEPNSFNDLGNAIRKCLTDMNIPISLDARKIKKLSNDNTLGAACVTGRIRYRAADGFGRDGVLLYIKPTLIGDENADILNYSKTHPEFPHQSTADQFFDEDQFESYRSLGYQTARSALNAVFAASLRHPGWTGSLRKYRTERICSLLTRTPK